MNYFLAPVHVSTTSTNINRTKLKASTTQCERKKTSYILVVHTVAAGVTDRCETKIWQQPINSIKDRNANVYSVRLITRVSTRYPRLENSSFELNGCKGFQGLPR